jgi:hypothetical protein
MRGVQPESKVSTGCDAPHRTMIRREVDAMETAKQISVFLENKPGRLANVLSALAQEKVNITAMTVMSHDRSALRLVTTDPAKTAQALRVLGISFTETEVLIVDLRHQVGALAHVCELLGSGHVNIDYCYCSSGGKNGKTIGVFKVSNIEKATRLLGEPVSVATRRRLEGRALRDRRSYHSR